MSLSVLRRHVDMELHVADGLYAGDDLDPRDLGSLKP